MAEIKNSFQGSKMNQDLDDRLIPNGSYRSGTNIQVSNSESDDVGTLQTVLGNFELTDFGIPDTISNLEVIGQVVDMSKDLIIVFITNSVSDDRTEEDSTGQVTLSSGNTIASATKTTSKNYICVMSPEFIGIIVEGSFLKFSKLFPVSANILEDLLFFTDNLNQPRKINIKSAIADNTYYTSEDQISVAKYYPYEPISFITSPTGYKKLGLVNKQDKYLPPSFAAAGIVYDPSNPDLLILKNGLNENQINLFAAMQPHGTEELDISADGQSIVAGLNKRIKVTNLSVEGAEEAYVISINMDAASPKNCEIKLETENGAAISTIATSLPTWSTGHVFGFSWPNPDYDASFTNSGESRYLEDKFVKFSYRFKFDDGEYSLMAPFTQAAFIPKQHGYFVGRDAKLTGRKGVVNFMENQVTNVTLNIPVPSTSVDNLITEYKVDEVQILSKASGDQNIKVITDLSVDNFDGLVDAGAFSGTGTSVGSGYSPTTFESDTQGGSGTGLRVRVKRTGDGTADDYGALDSNFLEIIEPGKNYKIGDIISISASHSDPVTENHSTAKFIITSLRDYIEYNYNSQQPIKVLPEKEVTRVSDIVPIKALAQAVVGNRVVYGNFLQKYGNIEKLDYDIEISDKNVLSSTNQQIKEHPNHTVKQGRTYQVGVVLRDKYGRLSNVILNDDIDEKSSTIYVPYTAGGSDPLEYFGKTLKIKWNREIPDDGPEDWPGLYNEKTNPLGWYSYQIVVKQKEQDYYNVYVPGSLSGNIVFKGLGNHNNLTYEDAGGTSHIVLSGDNINKIPRELKEVGGNDQQFGSETSLFCVVGEPSIATGNTYAPSASQEIKISQQLLDPKRIQVEEIKTFRNLGDWTMYKGVDLNHLDLNGGQYSSATFIYPGVTGEIDPLYLGSNKNPYVAKLSTKTKLGYSVDLQRPSDLATEPQFSENLHVFETSPVESALEIFYETTTSGLISDLNTSIRTAEPTGVLTGISPITFTLQEGDAVDSDASNTFEVMKGVGATQKIANQLSKINLVSVTDGTGTVVTSKFEVVQATAGGSGTSPTFKIRNKQRFLFTDGSYDGNCKFTFVLRASCPDSEGTQISKLFTYKNFRVTNKKPILYSLTGPPSQPDFNALNSTNGVDDTRIIDVGVTLDSSPYGEYGVSNKLSVSHTGTGYAETTKVMYISRDDVNQGIFANTNSGNREVTIGYFSFVTNGFDAVTTFDANTSLNENNSLNSTTKRIRGLKPVLKSVKRFSAIFETDDNDADFEKYYFPNYERFSTSINSGADKTFEFQIVKTNTNNSQTLYELKWMPPGQRKVTKSELGNNVSTSEKASWLYEITTYLEDAFDGSTGFGAGAKRSDDFKFHFIIHR